MRTTQLVPAGTTRPVRVQNLTGLQEDVLYAVGYAQRVGALVRVEQVADGGHGSVTVRVHHTLLVPLVLPKQLAAVELGRARDWMDYVELGLRCAPWLLGGGIAFGVYELIHKAAVWLGVHGHVIATGITSALAGVAVLGLLALLGGGGRGGGCVGLHCGGCKG